MKALIVVDMQNDFIYGSLANPAAQAIVDNVAREIEYFDGNVILTKDMHYENYLSTQEGKKLPIEHCKFKTRGWFIPKILAEAGIRHDNCGRGYTKVLHKETFGFTKWDQYLSTNYDEIYICGTCTDICVISNALIIKAMYPEMKITVLKDLCAGSTPEKHEAALEVMRSCQIDIADQKLSSELTSVTAKPDPSVTLRG